MADPIEQLRASTEADLGKLLGRLGPSHRRAIEAAVERYGSVRAIPPEFWEGLKREIDTEAASVLLLLLIGTYKTQTRRIARTGTAEQRRQALSLVADEERLKAAAGGAAARMGRTVADEYIDGARERMARNIDDKAAELNDLPPAEAAKRVRDEIKVTVGAEAGESAVVTNTTKGVTLGQSSAGDDVGRQLGAEIGVAWITERDSKVCPICRPLHGQTADEWDAVLAGNRDAAQALPYIQANGGPPAHPNCRCELRHFIDNVSDN